ncbi:zinc finger, CCHC-type containing protein [Tanacetum coccineum]|uniref:Zinc finger, CCHC-type containing protein n=1 Tax=Tanacetum coccineum TaxID=301880 RepID=A0ABQ5GRN2_9ASTR
MLLLVKDNVYFVIIRQLFSFKLQLLRLAGPGRVGSNRMDVEVDRLSSLPDGLIYRILSYVDIVYSIRLSDLSSRWRFIWTLMPNLNFGSSEVYRSSPYHEFVNNVLSSRNNTIDVFFVSLDMLAIDGTESSKSLKHLTLIGTTIDCRSYSPWNLQALTTLHLHYARLDNCSSILAMCQNLKNLTLKGCKVFERENSDGFTIINSRLLSLTLKKVECVKSLALSLEIVELISSSVEVVSNQPSPFASLKSLKISPFIKGLKYHPYIQEQTAMEINLSTEVKNYLLDRSPNATFTMVSHEEASAIKITRKVHRLMEQLRKHLQETEAYIGSNMTDRMMTNVLEYGSWIRISSSLEHMSLQTVLLPTCKSETLSRFEEVPALLRELQDSLTYLREELAVQQKLEQEQQGLDALDSLTCLRLIAQYEVFAEDKLNYLEHLIPAAPVPAFVGQQVPLEALATHAAWFKGQKEIVVLMIMTMEPDIQWNLENLGAYHMLQDLKTLFSQQAEQELLQIVREFHACKQEEGQSVSSYVLKMKSYKYNLERLGHPVSLNLASRQGLEEKKYKNKKPQLAARGNNQEKGKSKLAYAPKPKIPPPLKKKNPAKDSVFHQCGDTSHWKRNCPQYLSELLKNKKLSQGASTSGIFTIELFSFPGKSWVYDTGCGTHICNTTQGLGGSRKLKPGALSLYMANGQRAAVEAIGSYHLNNVVFSAVPKDGIYEIDLSNSNTNNSSTYAVINKRAKLNLDSTLLWHCRLGHISKKCIEKLQHDGLLNSTNIKSFEKCVSCMSGKMARKPYSHQVERAKDLLGLIHTDHKHEVFETFKVFQKEVENQLGKTIKSLRSDRGGEYMSQEFLDHLKEHGIISHHTPPYTPQHNGVSERRNRTLLNMVRSMMSQTTLSKSFWDYALESAARILNMVPTKKVEKTPYKVWHGQALKMSYLKV